MADAPDLGLRNHRFRSVAFHFKANSFYEWKTGFSYEIVAVARVSKMRLVLAQILAHSRSGVSKIEARLSYVDDKTLLYLAEVLNVQLQELFPTRPPGNRIYDFIEKLETTRF